MSQKVWYVFEPSIAWNCSLYLSLLHSDQISWKSIRQYVNKISSTHFGARQYTKKKQFFQHPAWHLLPYVPLYIAAKSNQICCVDLEKWGKTSILGQIWAYIGLFSAKNIIISRTSSKAIKMHNIPTISDILSQSMPIYKLKTQFGAKFA